MMVNGKLVYLYIFIWNERAVRTVLQRFLYVQVLT